MKSEYQTPQPMLTRFLTGLFIITCTLIPLWIFLLARLVFNPQGFWQNLVLTGLGVWVLGGLQVAFLIGGTMLFFAFMAESSSRR